MKHLSQKFAKRIAMVASTGAIAGISYNVTGISTPQTPNDPFSLDSLQSRLRCSFDDMRNDRQKSSSNKKKHSTSVRTDSTAKYGTLIESPQLYDKPLPFDTTLASDWNDWYKKIDLQFTHKDENITDISNEDIKCRMERLARATQEHVCSQITKMEKEAFEQLLLSYNIDSSQISQKEKDSIGEFRSDTWTRDDKKCGAASKHSGGMTKVLSNGIIFEKAGISVSVSSGVLPHAAVLQMTGDHENLMELLQSKELGDKYGNVEFFAASVSSVIHPWNPHAPTGHFNYRYFELGNKDSENDNKFIPKLWWFGGGGDLTPSIIYNEDCQHFHNTFKKVCDKHNDKFYNKFKKWCDDYFVIKHRNNERRGIGGIFFDDLSSINDSSFENIFNIEKTEKENKEELFEFVKDAASNWVIGYLPIVKRHSLQKYRKEEKEWQQIRRGRYAEFNLVYDRGTKFGLMKPGARHESILMSLPLTANWQYMRQPIYDFEKELYDVVMHPRDWI